MAVRRTVHRLLLSLLAAASLATAHAQTTLKEVKVKGQREKRTDVQRTAPTTTVKRERIDRWQASNIFETVEGVPGVALEGGPRASGTSFNIRGYNDSEDVLIKLDGAQKNFEKYRFGGTFIEPEMVKTVSVTRGPDLLSGAGALGGTVSAVTRDAADFLGPGERFGGRLKYGIGTVNDEILRHGAAYARPVEKVDLLVSATRRTAGDYKLPDGTYLADSAQNQRSTLFKGTVFATPALALSASAAQNNSSGLEAFDATGGQPGVFGSVVRTVDDSNYALNTRYGPPDSRWIDLTGVIGRSLTGVNDLHQPGKSLIANAFTGNINDYYAYDVVTVDLKNTSRFRTGPVANEVTVSLQGVSNEREAQRITSNAFLNNALYPGGYNPAQPSGKRESVGLVAIYTASWGPFSVAPGVRRDYYSVSVVGPTQTLLDQLGEQSTIKMAETTGSLALTYRPMQSPWILGYRYVQGFRPPLLDEAFTQGAFSRCIPAFLGPLAPASGVCGSLYQPEHSTTQEVSLNYAPLSPRPGLAIDGRVAAFVSKRTDILTSIRQVAPGVIGQPGWERRNGYELEGNFATRHFFGSAAYTRIEGEMHDVYVDAPVLPSYTIPGDTFSLTLGARAFDGKLDFGFRYRHVSERFVALTVGAGSILNAPILGTQPAYELLDFFLGWRPFKGTELRMALDNSLNETYFLNGFAGGQGFKAPGRNFRVSVAVEF